MEEIIKVVCIKDKNFSIGNQIVNLMPVKAGNGIALLPTVTLSPDFWKLSIDFNNEVVWLSVSKDFYNNVDIGDNIKVICKKGLFSKKLNIKTVKN